MGRAKGYTVHQHTWKVNARQCLREVVFIGDSSAVHRRGPGTRRLYPGILASVLVRARKPNLMLIRLLFVAVAISLWTVPLAHADNATPVTVPTTIALPTIPVAIATALPTEQPATLAPPVSDSSPVIVVPEHSTPITKVIAPTAPSPTAGVETQPTAPSPVVAPSAQAVPSPGNTRTIGSSHPTSAPTGSPPDINGLTPRTTGNNPQPGSPPVGLTLQPISAQAPAQLACHGKSHPTSPPFLQSPYNGWTSVASFVDHDSPDYTVDGTIVLANGLKATAADGQASDYFPAYWSPTLRQFINYDGHNGYDLELSYQPVLAAGDGTVEYAGWNSPDPSAGYGQMVIINHHNGYATLYGHLSNLEVKTGDKVIAGQEIGISGSTGHSSGPHLHFSVFHDCQVTDPYGWTGQGRDPLRDFNGERAAYLWLPGRDPLLLNPPPGWPTYPLSSRITLPKGITRAAIGHRHVPPVGRLLLLALPAPEARGSVSSGVALARTEGRITAEAEVLAPRLNELRAEGLLDNYEAVPAAGAVWVHGTASAAQLEGLAGVASLAGAQPRDLLAAEAGLAHAVLIQIGNQQAPALWPVGFRSGIHTWRPTVTVLNRHALVAGLAQPGQPVVITLHRGNTIAAVAQAAGDAETGGFVAMLHDGRGQPMVIQTGDVVQFAIGGRDVRVNVLPMSLEARSNRVRGSALSNSTVALSLLASGPTARTIVLHARRSGHFLADPRMHLTAGTLAVTTMLTTAGNQECAAGFVPGMEIHEGEPVVQGWTVGSNPWITVRRGGEFVLREAVHPAADGTFNLELARDHEPVILKAGDGVTLGSSRHHHTVVLPPVAALVQPADDHIQVIGPPYSRIHLSLDGVNRHTWTTTTELPVTGHARLTVTGGPVVAGDRAVARYVMSNGYVISSSAETYGIVVHLGSGVVTGQTRPGAVFTVRAVDSLAHSIGSALVQSDAVTGAFRGTVRTVDHRPTHLSKATRLIVHDGAGTRTYRLSPLAARLSRDTLRLVGQAAGRLHIAVVYTQGKSTQHRSILSSSGNLQWSIPHPSSVIHVVVSQSSRDGLTLQRIVAGPALRCSGHVSARGHTCGRAVH